MSFDSVDRRNFLLGAGALATAKAYAAKPASSTGRVVGANDRINVAVIGTGGRGFYVAREFDKAGKEESNAQIVAVCDVYQKRVNRGKEAFKVDGYLDYREVLNRSDVDAVIVATPDHWHAPIALQAMDKGKDVYLEKPMCHTVEEARRLSETVKETKRVLQVGSQTTSGKQWAAAKEVISSGKLGKLMLSQGSYHRNSTDGEWNWPIDPEAGPDGKGENFIDWKMWLGNAQKRDWAKDNGNERFFRFRKFWDYSGGIATDLYYHVVAPMNICWGEPQFPYKVMAGGGQYAGWQNDIREVPDTFHLIGEYSKGHSIVLSSSMGNGQHIPGLIRGHGATLIMVQDGRFEGPSRALKLRAEFRKGPDGKLRYIVPELEEVFKGQEEIDVPVEEQTFPQIMQNHVKNFLSCMRTRQKPQLDVDTGARAQVLITMAVQSYRQGKVLYFDEKNWKIVDKAPAKA